MSTGTIRDVGYKRYLGSRRNHATRWTVVFRNFISIAWQGWGRTRLWFIGALITTVSLCAVLYISQSRIFSVLAGAGGQLTFADGLVPFSFRAILFPFLAFICTLTVVARTIAKDLRAGAFEFYFSRPVTPLDYLLGKLAGSVFILGIILIAFPMILAIYRVGLTSNLDEALDALILLPKVLFIGSLATLAYAAVPLGFSALASKPRHAVAAWLGFYLIFGTVMQGLAHLVQMPELAASDLKSAVLGVAFGLFEVTFSNERVVPPLGISIASLLAYSAAGLAIAYRRVVQAHKEGLGGG